MVSGRMPAAISSVSESWRWVVDGRVDGQRLGVPEVEQPLEQLQRVEEGQSGVVAPHRTEGDDGRHPAVEIPLHQVWYGWSGKPAKLTHSTRGSAAR